MANETPAERALRIGRELAAKMKRDPRETDQQWAERMLKRGDVFAGPAKEQVEELAKLPDPNKN